MSSFGAGRYKIRERRQHATAGQGRKAQSLQAILSPDAFIAIQVQTAKSM
jgi:hypothetical protein